MTNEELIRKYQSGDVFALNELAEANEGLIKFFASKYTGLAEFDDLVQEGWTGFLRGVDTFQPDKENAAKFSTWAAYYIKGAIMRYLSRQPPKDVKSLQETIPGSDVPLQDTLQDEDAELAAFRKAEQKELRTELETVMREVLPLKQRQIVKLRVGWDNGIIWTLEDIARLYDLSTRQAVLASFQKAIWRMIRSKWGREQIKLRRQERYSKVYTYTETAALLLIEE